MLKRNIVAVVIVGLVLGGAAVAWANGAPSRPTLVATDSTGAATASTAPADRQAKRQALRACMQQAQDDAARTACLTAAGLPADRLPMAAGRNGLGLPGPGVLGKAVHGTLLVPGENGSWQTVTFDRGTVADATTTSTIVLSRPDGQTVGIALGGATKYHGVADAASLQKGKPAMVVSINGTATQVMQKHQN
ncbi:MAG TPA: hypothetical protein VFJ85_14785 [Acidimicrobiales bacterium]|nr:hypothetical protein [Acidimicrobiales bacterium]